MKITRIVITFEPAEDELPHATTATWEKGKWLADGPVFSRLQAVMHDMWQLFRVQLREGPEK